MPTLQQQIAGKFIAALSDTKVLEEQRIDNLRTLLANGKKLKADDLVKLFTEPLDGDVR